MNATAAMHWAKEEEGCTQCMFLHGIRKKFLFKKAKNALPDGG
ncbi:MAG TPA: hypothetical protein VFP59_19945 [Candidatus Angelobacter sp.]|nr:hypothetical protein [Candidatus Angelobacter sp.]